MLDRIRCTFVTTENVRERLLEQGLNPTKKDGTFMAPNRRLKGYLDGQDDEIDTTPIADLFPHCTGEFARNLLACPLYLSHTSFNQLHLACSPFKVLFADIAGTSSMICLAPSLSEDNPFTQCIFPNIMCS